MSRKMGGGGGGGGGCAVGRGRRSVVKLPGDRFSRQECPGGSVTGWTALCGDVWSQGGCSWTARTFPARSPDMIRVSSWDSDVIEVSTGLQTHNTHTHTHMKRH